MSYLCGIDEPPLPDDLPDTGGMCCPGAIMNGPQRCTCWRPVYAPEQTSTLDPEPVSGVRPDGMCGDCAYRPGSPEKSGDPAYRGDADELEQLAATATPFYCHDGMRRVTKWVHPSGAEVTAPDGAYAPPFTSNVPHKVDGSAAYLCAGWNARRRALNADTSKGPHRG